MARARCAARTVSPATGFGCARQSAKTIDQSGSWIETDYRAPYTHGDRLDDLIGEEKNQTSAIRLPRDASRILLEVTDVRVKRLQNISEANAPAEGIVRQRDDGFGLADTTHYHSANPRISYWSLWEAINGAGSVETNSWVWAVLFERINATTKGKAL